MRTLFPIAVFAAAIAVPAWSAPLQREHVSADAKWLLHWDLDNFRGTKVGGFINKELLDTHLAKPKADLKLYFDFDLEMDKVHSVTAYGTDYKSKPDANGVLLIWSALKAQQALDRVIQKQVDAGAGDAGPVRKLKSEPYLLYSINNELFVAQQKGDYLLLSKSKTQIEKAANVLAGRAANAASSPSFSGYSPLPNSFFVLGVAEGFSESALPPQTKIFQNAEGGQLVLSEKDDMLLLNVSLKAKSIEVAQQVQQVLQGIVALGSLNQDLNPDLLELARSTKVARQEKLVTVIGRFPVAKAIAKLAETAKTKQQAAKTDKPAAP